MRTLHKEVVSVIIPFYNCENFMSRCLTGLLNQTYRKLQIIIVNDGSTDGTEESFKSKFYGKFIRAGFIVDFISQENQGVASAFNTGLASVRGEFLTWVDPDDILHPDAILRKLLYLKENIRFGFVRNNAVVVSENDLHTPLYSLKSSSKSKIFKDLLFERNMPQCAGNYLVRTDVFFSSLKGEKIIDKYRSQNWPSLLAIAYFNECGFIDDNLNTIVSRKSSLSKDDSYGDVIDRINEHEALLLDILHDLGDTRYVCGVKRKYSRLRLLNVAKFENYSDLSKYSPSYSDLTGWFFYFLTKLRVLKIIWKIKSVKKNS